MPEAAKPSRRMAGKPARQTAGKRSGKQEMKAPAASNQAVVPISILAFSDQRSALSLLSYCGYGKNLYS